MAAVQCAPGCSKCGKTGHWSSHCTVPQDQWIPQCPRSQGAGAGPSGTQSTTQHDTQQGGGGTQAQPERRSAPQPAGCFKCGKSGHWSRDCSAPQNQWIPRDGGAGAIPAGGTDENDVPANGVAAAPAAGVKRKAARKKRPKITVEDLQKDSGFKQLLDVFPTQFRAIFKGLGHEAGDLRRLLDMYERWHRAVAPALQYDAFLEDLEKMGQTHALKMELRGQRDSVMRAAAPEAEAPPEAAPAAADGQADAGAAARMGDDDDDYDMDDDELVALQAEQWEQAAPEEMFDDIVDGEAAAAHGTGATAGGGAAPTIHPSQEALDEELLALAALEDEEDDEPGAANAGGAAAAAPQTASQEALDEELLALAALEDDDDEAAHMEGTGAAVLQSTTQEALDEELLALAALEDDDEGDAAPMDAAIAVESDAPHALAGADAPAAAAPAPDADQAGTEGQQHMAPLAPQADTQLLGAPGVGFESAPAGAAAVSDSPPSSDGAAAAVGGATAATGAAAAAREDDRIDEDERLLEAAVADESAEQTGDRNDTAEAADAAMAGQQPGGDGGGSQGTAVGRQLPAGVDVADMDDDVLLELAMA